MTGDLHDIIDLESVIITAELSRRPSRAPDYEGENHALIALAQEMASSPNGILQKLVETALSLCRAHSAGISLLEEDGKNFHWPAIAGQWASHVGVGTPRDFGPCGTVLDRNVALLFSHPERHFTYLGAATPSIEEALLIPFYVDGKAVGTIWVIAHDRSRRFDVEDLRVMTNLSAFAATAYQTLLALNVTIKSNQELQQSAVALRDSEARFRSMAAHALVMVWVTEPGGRCTFLSRSWYEFTGQTPDTGLGFGWMNAVHPEDRHRAEMRFQAANDRREPFRLEYRLKRKDGEYRWAIDTAVPSFSESGEFQGYIGSVIDITERKQVEEALLESEARYRAMFEATSVGMSESEPETGRVLRVNEQLARLTGYTRAK